MMPTGAPTNSFSARCPSRAIWTSSIGSVNASRKARSSAISSAALDESPLPSGTVDSMRMSAPPTLKPAFPSTQVIPCR